LAQRLPDADDADGVGARGSNVVSAAAAAAAAAVADRERESDGRDTAWVFFWRRWFSTSPLLPFAPSRAPKTHLQQRRTSQLLLHDDAAAGVSMPGREEEATEHIATPRDDGASIAALEEKKGLLVGGPLGPYRCPLSSIALSRAEGKGPRLLRCDAFF
jgi:hypothetical protein